MVVSGVTITDERDKIVDFSDPYIIVQQGVLMRVEDEGATIDAFKSGELRLASQNGTTNAALGEEFWERHHGIMTNQIVYTHPNNANAETPPFGH